MTQREGAYPESLSLRCDPTLGHCAGKTQFMAYSPQLPRLAISRPLLKATLIKSARTRFKSPISRGRYQCR